jgi:leucyl aminopeptidase
MAVKTRAQLFSEKVISKPSVTVFHFEDDRRPKGTAAQVDSLVDGALSLLLRKGEFRGTKGEVKSYPFLRGRRMTRISLVGLGKREHFQGYVLRAAATRAGSEIAGVGLTRIGAIMPDIPPDTMASPRVAQTVVESLLIGAYRFTSLRAKLPEPGWAFPTEIAVYTATKPSPQIQEALEWASALAEATNYARDLDNLPGNVITPAELADRARALAKDYTLQLKVLDETALQKHGFGGLLAVGQGSQNPPRLVILEHKGEGEPVILVGKGITFDSGGISLKSSTDMDEMKFDKSGAIAVLGAMRAVAALQLPRRVVGVIACAENLPSGSAQRPGDIITMYSGKTVEVANTDAEGRLVLADAIAYAEKTYQPAAIIDIATLTGACVVALGNHAAGLFTKEDGLAERLTVAGIQSGDRLWRLPLWPEYGEQMKSNYADVKNIGGKEGGAITGAWFLSQFVQETPWAHVDIAGTAWTDSKRPPYTAGATGFGVRLFLEFLRVMAATA